MPGTATLLHPVATLVDGEHAAVFGAPGSGKTTGSSSSSSPTGSSGSATPPTRCSCCRPRGAAATALRDELAVRLGVTTRGPLARTANSIAFQLVRAFTGEPVTLLTGAEHDQIVGELLEGGIRDGFGPAWPDPLTPEVRALRGFRSELRDLMMRAVEHGVDAAAARASRRARRRAPSGSPPPAFLAEYAEVKEQLRPTQFDSAELGAFAAAIVRRSTGDPAASAALGTLAGLRLLVVDDAQEATEATAALLGAFAARGVAVVAFGDPDVASNGFRGGRPELLGSLGRPCSTAPPVRRVGARRRASRAPGASATWSESVTAHIGTALGGAHRPAPLAAPATSGRARPDPIRSRRCSASRRRRTRRSARRSPGSCASGTCSTACRGRRWRSSCGPAADVPAFERGLALADVPTAGDAARTALRDAPAAAALLSAASLVLGREPLTPELAVDVAHRAARAASTGSACVGCGSRCDTRSSRPAAPARATSCSSTRSPRPAASRPSMPRPAAARRGSRSSSTRRVRVAEAGGTIEEVLWSLWEGSGLAAEWGAQARGTGVLAEEANRALDAAVALFAAATRYVEREPDAPAVRFVDEVLASELPEDSLAPRRSAETGARHHAAGAHRPRVRRRRRRRPAGRRLAEPAPAGHAAARRAPAARRRRRRAPERRCPRPRPSPRPASSVRGDELRLFALAASRARRQLVLSCTANDDEQPSMLMGYATERVRARRRRPLHLRGLVGSAPARARGDRRRRGGLRRSPCSPRRACPVRIPTTGTGSRSRRPIAPLVDLDGDPEALVRGVAVADRSRRGVAARLVHRPRRRAAVGLAASIGTLVHAVVEEAGARDDGDTSIETLWAAVEERWRELRFEAGWVGRARAARRPAHGRGCGRLPRELRRRRQGAARCRGAVHARRRSGAHHRHHRPGRGVARRHHRDRRPQDRAHAAHGRRRRRSIRSSRPTSSPHAPARCRTRERSAVRSSSTSPSPCAASRSPSAPSSRSTTRPRRRSANGSRQSRARWRAASSRARASSASGRGSARWQYRVHLVPAVSA